MKKLVLTLIVLVVFVVGALVLLFYSGSDSTGEVIQGNVKDGVVVFVMTGENFKYFLDGINNPDLVVNEGDKVRIEFSSVGGFHDWVVDEFDAATDKVREDEGNTYVEFVANKKGVFEYYCSVGEHRVNGMRGNLIVQ